MDIKKSLSRIDDLRKRLPTYHETIEAHQVGMASLYKQISEGFDEISDYLQSNDGPCDPFHYSLVHFGGNFSNVLPRFEDFAKGLEKKSGIPIVIHQCEPVPVKKEENYKGTDHSSAIKQVTLGTLARGGYSIEDWNFWILLDEFASSGTPGLTVPRGKYKLSPKFIETLNQDSDYRFFNINHIAKEADIFIGPDIPINYRRKGRVMTPEEFAEQLAF